MNARTLSVQELLRLCLESNDPVAWQEFVRRFQPLIAGVTRRTVRRLWREPTPDEVDELVQDAFLKLCANDFRALRSFEWQHEKSLYGYIKVVASNVAQDWVRTMRAGTHGGDIPHVDLEGIQNLIASASENAEHRAQIEEIWRRVERLAADPDLARECLIFRLYFRYGLTAKAISQLPGIGLTVKGVESALLRMIRRLRDDMNGPPD